MTNSPDSDASESSSKSFFTKLKVGVLLFLIAISPRVACDPTTNTPSFVLHSCVLQKSPDELVMDKSPDELIELLGVNQVPISDAAARKLVRANDPQPILKAMDHSSGRVRRHAVRCLAVMPPTETSLRVIRKALRDDVWRVRTHAARALAEIGDESDIQRIGELLDDDSEKVQYLAMKALVRLNKRLKN